MTGRRSRRSLWAGSRREPSAGRCQPGANRLRIAEQRRAVRPRLATGAGAVGGRRAVAGRTNRSPRSRWSAAVPAGVCTVPACAPRRPTRPLRLPAAFCAILRACDSTARGLLGEERRERIVRWLGGEGKVRASDLALRLRRVAGHGAPRPAGAATPGAAARPRARIAAQLARTGQLRRAPPRRIAAKRLSPRRRRRSSRRARSSRSRAGRRRSSSPGAWPTTSRRPSSPPTPISRSRSPTIRA